MPRLGLTAPLALATAMALPLLAGGCYSYDTAVRNASAQDVQITILKGTRQREIGNAILAPGGSIGWSGATNGPVLARVVAQGTAHDVELPRRALTTIDVYDSDIEVTIAGVEQTAEPNAEPTPSDTTETPLDPTAEETNAVESDDDQIDNAATQPPSNGEPETEEMIDLIEDQGA